MEDLASSARVVLLPAYPISLAGVYLISSIWLKIRRGKANIDDGLSSISDTRARLIRWLLCIFTVSLAPTTAVFLFFAASLLPDPDLPYRPSATNIHTWITAIIFEAVTVVLDCVAAPNFLAYGRLALLIAACSIRHISSRRGLKDPARESLLSSDTSEEGRYGTVEASPPKPGDAQSTNWLDYLVGLGVIFPLIWPADSVSMQLRAIVCIIILIAQRIVNVLVPLQLGHVVASLGKGHVPYKELSLYIACRAVQGQQGVLASIRALLWIPFGQATYQRLTELSFKHVLSLSLQFHLGKRLGEVMSALNKGSALNTFIDSLVFQLFPMVADIGVAAIYFLVNFDPFYSLIILAMGGTYLFVTIYMAKYRGRARRQMVNCDREMEAIKSDAIMAYDVVHYNSAVDQEQRRLSDRVTAFQRAEFGVLVSLNLLNTVQNLIFTLGVALVSFLSAYNISIGVEKVPLFVSLVAYLAQLQAPLGFFGSFYTQIQNNLIDAERMLALFNEKPSVVDKPDAIDLVDCKGHITFEGLTFAYDPASVAIVGESGSGKSTLLRLLFRFYHPDSGRILIDGQSVEDITIESLRKHLGVVPQETMLFNDTLMYNLLYANPSATEEDVYAACRAASVHDKIMALPDGYQTQVGERGLRLSGGEKQRIAIARVLLKSPRIILMDEATASLDSETEKSIQASLAKISIGRTTITIAHRLSTITHCDEIVVFHNGTIVERGNHTQLLTQRGRYWQMWDKQTREPRSPSAE
ncbi:putative transport protein [Aspergillus novofumigatus IBT 16806]|uniref:Putative transport protein n=1 Tax=Aspergillus novofumigatus (strain IBT 16806) TaxID=1392255 RepID=A0A2I1BT13_ASPN1|nr:putative transport protein [Aspergillus novofumigatus IBT 16806]PKX88431.1 putative transport protein [Aspergillus novofumigatus IBT 16806]